MLAPYRRGQHHRKAKASLSISSPNPVIRARASPDHKKFERDHGYREKQRRPASMAKRAGRDHGRPPARSYYRRHHSLPPGFGRENIIWRGHKALALVLPKTSSPQAAACASLNRPSRHHPGPPAALRRTPVVGVVGRTRTGVLTGLIVANILDNVFDRSAPRHIPALLRAGFLRPGYGGVISHVPLGVLCIPRATGNVIQGHAWHDPVRSPPALDWQ